MNNKKRFAKKFKRGTIKLECIVKFLKLLVNLDKLHHKLAKNIKFTTSKITMEILQDKNNMRSTTLLTKSNMRLSTINDMGVIIPDPNTMKSNDMAS